LALNIVDPGLLQAAVSWYQGAFNNGGGTNSITGSDTSGLTDGADAAPTFDTAHVVYTSTPQDAASQDSTGDNSNGLQDPLHLVPSLSYAYTSGYSNTHTESSALTVGVTQSFSYQFEGLGGATTLTASGSFSTADAATINKSTTITSSIQAPFDIPKGKIYEEKLLFAQEQAQVPYISTVHVDGYFPAVGLSPGFGVGSLFGLLSIAVKYPNQGFGPSPAPYKNVNWSDVSGSNTGFTQPEGTYVLPGTLTMYAASNSTVKIYDVTNQTAQNAGPGTLVTQYAVPDAFSSAQGAAAAQGLQAAAPGGAAQGTGAAQDPQAAPVGVDHTMDDAGRSFYDTANDDLLTGGAGNDHIFLSGGQDIAHVGAGNDTIVANGNEGSLLDGGAGDDAILLASSLRLNALQGGDGNDFLQAYAPYSMVYGGAGDDTFLLREDISGGSVITDSDGANKLFINTADGGAAQLGFERISGSDNLYILLGGDQTYNRDHDVVWANFFASPDNQINGLGPDQIAAPASAIPDPAVATGTPGATGAIDSATGLVVPNGMNQTLFSDADQIASAATLSTGQEQALVVGASAISKVLTEFPTVLQFVAPDVLQTAVAGLLHATSPLSDVQSQALAADIIANPYTGGMFSVAQSIPTPPLIGADSTNLNTVGNMIFALAHT
jgi:hypothetical protein